MSFFREHFFFTQLNVFKNLHKNLPTENVCQKGKIMISFVNNKKYELHFNMANIIHTTKSEYFCMLNL